MLRKQSVYDPMDFLAGDGEMAERIRRYDWRDHSFGPPDTWPQTLRSALSIALNSAFPTGIYWGPELRLLYNDAWAPIPGPRHPDALGARAEDVWSDIWHVIQPQFAELISSGKGLFLEDQLLPMSRYGFEEETYWNYSFTPLRAEDGRIVGIFNSGSETTGRVIEIRNAEGLVALNQDLRVCGNTDEAMDLVLERLGKLLKASRTAMLERTVSDSKPVFSMTREWCDVGFARAGTTPFTPEQVDRLLSGGALQLFAADPALTDSDRRQLEDAGIGGFLAIPWMESGQAMSVLYLQFSQGVQVHPVSVALVEKVLETAMVWINRERHREREKVMAAEIDHRARNMLAVIQSITRMTKGTDVAEVKAKLIDRFTALSRVHSLLGQKRWTNLAFRDLLEDELAPLGAEISDRVTLDGPRLVLSPQQAQPFAMILHELMTNAMKYGSIAQNDGRLSVSWSVDADQNMTLDWVESGAPTKAVPDLGDTTGGFGSVLLSNLVKGQFGGDVACTLTENGISYRFILPVDRQVRPSAPPAEAETQRSTPQNAVLSVMVVEDNALISLDLADLLASEGHHVFGQFGTVETALEALRRGTPDIVLLDAELGDESSAPVAEALKAKSVPFVVVSGHGGDFAADDPRVGAPRIEKPIRNSELMSVVKQTVQ